MSTLPMVLNVDASLLGMQVKIIIVMEKISFVG